LVSVTGKLAELDSCVPVMTETELKRRGAKYEKAKPGVGSLRYY
jgi:hypothetical protein